MLLTNIYKQGTLGDYIRVFKAYLWNKPQSSIQLITDDRWGTDVSEAYFSFQGHSFESSSAQVARIPRFIDYSLGRLSSGVPQWCSELFFQKLSHHTYP